MTPRYLVSRIPSIFLPSILYVKLLFPLVFHVMERTLHFLTLNSMPQVCDHWTRVLRSCWRASWSCFEVISLYRRQSSAKRRTEDCRELAMSLMKMRNRAGPSTEPWGTPESTGHSLDVKPSTTTRWVAQKGAYPPESVLVKVAVF